MLFLTRFSNTSRVFFDTANLTIHCNLRYETMFSVFHVFEIFKKKTQKKRLKPRCEKNIEKGPSRDPFWDPKSMKNYIKNPKNRQKAEKK